MPYLSVTLSPVLSALQKQEIKTAMGRLITILPGKSESVLMIHLQDGSTMYFRGEEVACAYIQVTCYGTVNRAAKEQFTQQVTEMLQHITGIAKADIFLTFTEKDCWGMGGNLI